MVPGVIGIDPKVKFAQEKFSVTTCSGGKLVFAMSGWVSLCRIRRVWGSRRQR